MADSPVSFLQEANLTNFPMQSEVFRSLHADKIKFALPQTGSIF
jgi:hypothetical protein